MHSESSMLTALSFRQRSVKHLHQTQALARSEFLLSMCSSVDFLIVAGPTGVGKTHLLNQLKLSIFKSNVELVQASPSSIPCISTMAVADGAKKFGWKRFWRDALRALGDPFSDSRPEIGGRKVPEVFFGEGITTSRLREQVEAELRLRGTKVWIVDEAQHMLLGGSAGMPGDQFDVLKSVAQTTGVKIVLCGTYQLPNLLAYSGQVMRRSAIVDVRRYDLNDKQQLLEFVSVALALFKLLPVEAYPDPKVNCEELYMGTLGCIGVLKDWIARAWAMSQFEKKTSLAMEHFSETRLSATALQEMNAEIQAGESLQSPHLEQIYRDEVTAPNSSQKRKSSKQKPGQRKPGRDPVGRNAIHPSGSDHAY